MAAREVTRLKEALFDQYIIMKKLCMELEEEREASASAATEALSMILRLQREKAAEKMEASQYKRLAEEKMHHDEETLAILEELMEQKELEISFLRFQLQEYKHKLSGINAKILDIGKERISNNVSSCGSDASTDKSNLHGLVRRNVSLPILRMDKLYCEMDNIDENSPVAQFVWRKLGEYNNRHMKKYKERELIDLIEESSIEDGNSDGENIKCSEFVQRNATLHPVSSGEALSACSWHSAMSNEISYGRCMELKTKGTDSPSKYEDPGHVSNCVDDLNRTKAHSTLTHDIFEVPGNLEESNQETKSMIAESDLTSLEAAEYIFTDDHWLNNAFMNRYQWSKFSSSDEGVCTHNNSIMDPTIECSTSQTDLEQIKRRLQQLETDKIMKVEDSRRGNEQVKLLKDIYNQLNVIESNMRTFNHQKYSQQDDARLVSVMEAVLSFSI
ncbi:uncharacterized protein [Typha angustifolia]|uniref:uncharacterized protein n=1 Tax=Typha angustifolia TaxID=59011 RepID=UPI003C2F81FC